MLDSFYTFLAKTGFTDPLHAPMTHMPIGLLFGAVVFSIVAIVFKKKDLELTARHASILALVMVVPTILFGIMDWIHYFRAAMIFPIKMKMVLASIVLILLSIGVAFGNRLSGRKFVLPAIYATAFLCAVGLGWFGAGLVYGRGGTPLFSAKTSEPQTVQNLSSSDLAAIRRGEPIYNSNCQGCHGAGTNFLDTGYPIVGSKKIADEKTFVAFIRAPLMRDGTTGDMPGFEKKDISDAQAGDLFRFVAYSAQNTWKK